MNTYDRDIDFTKQWYLKVMISVINGSSGDGMNKYKV